MARKRLYKNLQRLMMIFCGTVALLILIDFVGSKNTITEKVVHKKQRLENRHNVGGNYYYGYCIITNHYKVICSKEFYKEVTVGENARIKTSLLFNNVNEITLVNAKRSEIYSLRIASGFLCPLIALIILGLGYTKGSSLQVLVFVTELVLILNFSYIFL